MSKTEYLLPWVKRWQISSIYHIAHLSRKGDEVSDRVLPPKDLRDDRTVDFFFLFPLWGKTANLSLQNPGEAAVQDHVFKHWSVQKGSWLTERKGQNLKFWA